MTSYIVDKYPQNECEVITFYTVAINFSAFADPFFIFAWVELEGYTLSFAIQAIICFFGLIPVYGFLQWFGPNMNKPLR